MGYPLASEVNVIKFAGLGYGIEPVEGHYGTLVLVVVIGLVVAFVVLSIMRGRKPPER